MGEAIVFYRNGTWEVHLNKSGWYTPHTVRHPGTPWSKEQAVDYVKSNYPDYTITIRERKPVV